MLEKIAAWLNADELQNGASETNGDFLRAFLVNFAKAVIALLDAIGEWPIEVE